MDTGSVVYSYVFEKEGALAPEHILENSIWLDVGNVTKDGAFDHHQDGGPRSAFESVMTNTDCYESLKGYWRKAGKESKEIIFHVHEYPDIDCVASIFAVQRMLRENAGNPAAAFDKETADQLTEYVNVIDSGKKKSISQLTLYAYFCAIGKGIEDMRQRSKVLISEGLKVFELVAEALRKNSEVDLFHATLNEYLSAEDLKKLDYYDTALRKVDTDRSNYQKDKDKNRVILKLANLWDAAEKVMKPVKAAIWNQLPSGDDEYVFAREDDKCVLTVYPYKIREENWENKENAFTSVVIALNPDIEGVENYSLLPLAEVLEQCEQLEEDLLYEKTGRYRRDHSCSREDAGRFSETPFFETSDPWYISEKGDIINVPRGLSLLPYNRILAMIENASAMTKRASLIRFSKTHEGIKIENTVEYGEISFGELYRKTRSAVRSLQTEENTRHLFSFVKIDPSMLRYSNNLLKACCLNMVGKSDAAISQDNILYIDYRTCLYTDPTITILTAIDRRNQSLGSLVDEEHLDESRICSDLKNLLEHQLELREIGSSLSKLIGKIHQKEDQIESFNERLVRLNSRIESDGLISDPLEKEAYAFINNTLGIDSLKESVTTSAQLLIKNAEQQYDREAKAARIKREDREKKEERAEKRRDEQLQAGIGLVSVLAVFSAWVDAFDFFAKLEPGVDEGWTSLMDCPPLMVFEIILAVLILVLGIIAGINAFKAWFGSSKEEADDPQADNDQE